MILGFSSVIFDDEFEVKMEHRMNIWLRLIAIFIAGLTISAIAQPGIATTPDTLKFAEVLVGEDSLSSVTITNSGDSALVINGIVMNSVEGNFALANPLTFPLTIAPDSTSPPVSVRLSAAGAGNAECCRRCRN